VLLDLPKKSSPSTIQPLVYATVATAKALGCWEQGLVPLAFAPINGAMLMSTENIVVLSIIIPLAAIAIVLIIIFARDMWH